MGFGWVSAHFCFNLLFLASYFFWSMPSRPLSYFASNTTKQWQFSEVICALQTFREQDHAGLFLHSPKAPSGRLAEDGQLFLFVCSDPFNSVPESHSMLSYSGFLCCSCTQTRWSMLSTLLQCRVAGQDFRAREGQEMEEAGWGQGMEKHLLHKFENKKGVWGLARWPWGIRVLASEYRDLVQRSSLILSPATSQWKERRSPPCFLWLPP